MKELLIYTVMAGGFFLLFMLTFYAHKKGFGNLAELLSSNNSIVHINRKHVFASILLIGAAIIKNSFQTPVTLITTNLFWLWFTATAALLLTLFVSISSVRKQIAVSSSFITAKNLQLSPSQIINYLFIRAIFIMAYEFFFRGILLQQVVADIGIITGIIINTALYVIAHWFSSKKEIVGCVPFGAILCFLTLASGSVWMAITLHLALSMPYEASLLYAIRYKKDGYKNALLKSLHEKNVV